MWIESEEDLRRHLDDPMSCEGLTMDYKRDLDRRDKAKMADAVETIGAMANAEGGQVLIGIDEKDGAPVREIYGLDDAEGTRKRLENALNANLMLVEPRPRVEILRAEGKEILVVRVLPSVRLAALWSSSESDKLRYPLRTGQGIDYLRPADVEARILAYGPRSSRIMLEQLRFEATSRTVTLYHCIEVSGIGVAGPPTTRRWANGPSFVEQVAPFGVLLKVGQDEAGTRSGEVWVPYTWLTPFLTAEEWNGSVRPESRSLGLLVRGQLGATTGGLSFTPRPA